MKNVLFIVYYFPPMGGSGVQRPLKFIKYLRQYGWNPIVLCPDPGAYHTFDTSLNEELKSLDVEVHRVGGNTPLHVAGNKSITLPSFVENTLRKISASLWLPDNKKGWIKPGFEKALQIIEEKNIELIFSTAAPYSNLMLAANLKVKTGLPTVMDLRDEWLESHLIYYPTDWHKRKMANIEKDTLDKADVITVINDAYLESFGNRFPDKDIRVVTQGYDPGDFKEVPKAGKKSKLRLLYSGLFYGDRKPDLFLKAVRNILNGNTGLESVLELQFQGGLSSETHEVIKTLNLTHIVKDFGYVDHKEAVKNLLTADALWLMIGHLKNADKVTVGKMFEYFGAKKPILALIPEGNGRELLIQYGAAYFAHPHSIEEIQAEIEALIADYENSKLPDPNNEFVGQFNRERIAGELAQIFTVISS